MARLLVVDDEEPMCELITRILREAGHETISTNRGVDAIAHLDAGVQFDLSILDVVMPGMAGDDLAREIRRRDPDAKVLYVTGYNEALFQARPVLWEGESFLDKPFTPAALCEAVTLALHGTLRPPAACAAAARRNDTPSM